MIERIPLQVALAFAVAVCAVAPPVSHAASALELRIVGADGEPVRDAVIELVALEARASEASPSPPGFTVDQIERQFVPHVGAVTRGTTVDFPNSDQIRHSIYSFSGENAFEIKLYKGVEAPPVRFDEAGVVVLGCNIHDYMLGFLYVLDSPYFGVSDEAGSARIAGVPAGRYRVVVRHPRATAQAVLSEHEVQLPASEPVAIALQTTPPPRPELLPPADELQDSLGGFGR